MFLQHHALNPVGLLLIRVCVIGMIPIIAFGFFCIKQALNGK